MVRCFRPAQSAEAIPSVTSALIWRTYTCAAHTRTSTSTSVQPDKHPQAHKHTRETLYLSVLDNVLEQLSARDVFHNHENVCGCADDLVPANVYVCHSACVSVCVRLGVRVCGCVRDWGIERPWMSVCGRGCLDLSGHVVIAPAPAPTLQPVTRVDAKWGSLVWGKGRTNICAHANIHTRYGQMSGLQ